MTSRFKPVVIESGDVLSENGNGISSSLFCVRRLASGMKLRFILHMKTAASRLVLVAAPDMKTARMLAKGAVQACLAACATIIPEVESHYRWRGKLGKSAEVLILFKTKQRQLAALEAFVLARHPYDVPEFLAFAACSGNARYLRWMDEVLQPPDGVSCRRPGKNGIF